MPPMPSPQVFLGGPGGHCAESLQGYVHRFGTPTVLQTAPGTGTSAMPIGPHLPSVPEQTQLSSVAFTASQVVRSSLMPQYFAAGCPLMLCLVTKMSNGCCWHAGLAGLRQK